MQIIFLKVLHNKKISSVLIAVCIIILGLFLHSNKNQVFYGDALGYYSYLPAFFIHDNLDHIDDTASINGIPENIAFGISNFKDNYPQNASHNTIIQYTYGIAALQSPAFISIYLIDLIRGVSTHGFEKRYQTAIKFIGLIYLFLGLLFSFLSLRFYYSRIHSVSTVLLLLLGTNLLWFGFFQFGMAHIPLFFLYALLIYLSIRLSQKFSLIYLSGIAFICGLIAVIRPTDIIAIFIPLIFFFRSIWLSPNGFRVLKSSWPIMLMVTIIFFVLPILPQLFYWKILTGEYLFYSYSDQGFNWTEPKILAGLFGAKNGWFTYTPLMLFAILGFFLKSIPRELKYIFWAIVPLYIYISYSWWCYNYINGFGSRPMIHIYPILAFGIAHLLSTKNDILKFITTTAMVITALVNLNYTNKAQKGHLFSDESTSAFNRSVFFKDHLDYNDLLLLDINTPQALDISNCDSLYHGVLDSTTNNLVKDSQTDFYYYLNKPNETFPQLQINEIIAQKDLDFPWIKLEVEAQFNEHIFMPYWHHKLVMEINQINGKKIYKSISINNKLAKSELDPSDIQIRSTIINKWGKAHFYYPTEGLNPGDMLKLYVWNTSHKTMKIKNISVLGCE